MTEKICPICNGLGVIIYTKDGYEYGRFCECREQENARARMNASGVSEEMQKIGFNDYIVNNDQRKNARDKAVEYYKAFLEKEKTRNNSIIFCGQVGSGKTMLSLAITNNLINHAKVDCYYMPYREGITELKSLVKNSLEYEKAMKPYKHSRVLVIDDLFKGKLTEADVNAMFEIVNYRYMNNKPIIVSTEKSPEEVQDFDVGIGSRILEMCKGNIIYMRGKDLNFRLEGIL